MERRERAIELSGICGMRFQDEKPKGESPATGVGWAHSKTSQSLLDGSGEIQGKPKGRS